MKIRIKKNLKNSIIYIVAMSLIINLSINYSNVEAKEVIYKYIVTAKNNKKIDEIVEKYGSSKISNKSKSTMLSLTEEQVNRIKEDDEIKAVEPNILITGSGNKSYVGKTDWNLEMIKACEQYETTENVKVALIDSGINYNSNINVTKRINLVDGDDDVSVLFEDFSGHGTAIAGIIAGATKDDYKYGINSNVELYSIKVLDDNNSAYLDKIIEAIYIAIENDVDIINMSFGTTIYSDALKNAIDDASKNGILLVAASGNRGNLDGVVEYPAAFENVLSVGAVDSVGEISSSCSTNGKVDVYAPGELICSTAIFNGNMVFSGTSMAVPHVVGAASVLLQKDKTKSPEFIKQLLINSANKNNKYGILDLQYALEIYDDFSEQYDEVNLETENIENNNQLITSNNVNYVEGSWYQIRHEEAVTDNSSVTDFNGNSYSSSAIQILVAGIRLPDQDATYMKFNKGETNEHCWWHAGTTDTVMYGTYVPNYLATMDFVYNVIMADKCNVSLAEKPVGMASYVYTEAKNNLIGTNVGDRLTAMGFENNVTNRRFMYWGILMHIVTDLYAHRSYVKKFGGRICLYYTSWVWI